MIEEELKTIGIEPKEIKRHVTGYMRKNKVASSIWHLVLQPNTDTKELFKKKNIGPHIVKYEFMRKPALTQCKKCQRFFHAASQCYMPYRCVKCTDKHNPGNCPLDQSNNKLKRKCVNCNGYWTIQPTTPNNALRSREPLK